MSTSFNSKWCKCKREHIMKTLIAAACLVAFALAEPPPSNSYLPPSAAGRSGGYPQGGPQGPSHGAAGGHGQVGGPQVIAARNLNQHGAAAHGFARNAGGQGHGQSHGQGHSQGHGQGHSHGAQARFGGHDHEQKGYDSNASPFGRNGLGESVEPANYNFGYMVNDYEEGTDFGHHEERQDERAEGEYHVVLPDGRKQTVSYEADERGFKPHISYEDSDPLARSNSGYDANANNVNGGHGNHGNHGNARSNNGY